MSDSGREALPDVREWSGDPPGCPGVVRDPPGYPGVVGRPSRTFRRPALRFGNGRDTLLDVPIGWEALPDVRKLSVALPDVWRPSWLFRSGWVALPDIREWSGDTAKRPGGLAEVREWSGGPPSCRGVVEIPFQMSGSGRKALLKVWEALRKVREASSEVREWSGHSSICP